jgi:probable F420-dependent oxidoreductase
MMTEATTAEAGPLQVFVRLPHSWCGASVEAVIRVADAAEELGFDGVSVQDHILASHGVAPCGHRHQGDDRMVMESLATLAFVAARTDRVRLLTGVLVLPFRPIVSLAKAGATVDVLSNGRFILGVGVGASPGRFSDATQNLAPHSEIARRELALVNLPGPRGKLMDEALEALNRLWTEDSASYQGSTIKFEDVDLYPKPIQKPRPPIWVGGRAAAAIRRAATLADGWFPSQASVSVVAAGRDRALEKAAAANRPTPLIGVNLFISVDRDREVALDVISDGLGHRFATEEALWAATMAGTPADVLHRFSSYIEAGCSVFDLKILPHTEESILAQMRVFAAEILPGLRK